MRNQSSENFPAVDKDSFIADNDASKSNTFYNELLHLPDVVIQTDLDFIITGWNDAAEKIRILPGAKGKNIFELDNLNFSEDSVETMKQQFRASRVWDGNIKFNRRDGLDIYFRSKAHYILDASGNPSSIMIINYNISQQIITEKKLLETEAMYKVVTDVIDQGILLIEANGKIIATNKKASEILGIPEQKLLGQLPLTAGSSWKVFRTDGRPFPDCELPVVVSLQTGFPQKNIEMRIDKPDGRTFWINMSSQAIVREGEFNPYAVVVYFTDISSDKMKAGHGHPVML